MICPGCGNIIEDIAARFCPRCGIALEEKKGCADAISQVYTRYIDWSAEYLGGRSGIKVFTAMFSGDGDYKRQPEHTNFFNACAAAAESFLAEFSTGGIQRGELLRVLDYALFDCHGETDRYADWMLLAVEKHFLPFAQLLTAEEAAPRYERYRLARKHSRGLPAQDEMLKILKKRAKMP